MNLVLIYYYLKNRIDDTPLFDPFEINYSVTEKSLLKNGYLPVSGVDVPMLEKQFGDTLISYQLDYECEYLGLPKIRDIESIECKNTKVIWRFCIIYLDKIDTVEIEKMVNRYDVDIISNFKTKQDFIDSSEVNVHFFVKHRFSKVIFRCNVGRAYSERASKKYELSIHNEFPWNDKDIKERRWIYDMID